MSADLQFEQLTYIEYLPSAPFPFLILRTENGDRVEFIANAIDTTRLASALGELAKQIDYHPGRAAFVSLLPPGSRP